MAILGMGLRIGLLSFDVLGARRYIDLEVGDYLVRDLAAIRGPQWCEWFDLTFISELLVGSQERAYSWLLFEHGDC